MLKLLTFKWVLLACKNHQTPERDTSSTDNFQSQLAYMDSVKSTCKNNLEIHTYAVSATRTAHACIYKYNPINARNLFREFKCAFKID